MSDPITKPALAGIAALLAVGIGPDLVEHALACGGAFFGGFVGLSLFEERRKWPTTNLALGVIVAAFMAPVVHGIAVLLMPQDWALVLTPARLLPFLGATIAIFWPRLLRAGWKKFDDKYLGGDDKP